MRLNSELASCPPAHLPRPMRANRRSMQPATLCSVMDRIRDSGYGDLARHGVAWRGVVRGRLERPRISHIAYPLFQPELRSIDRRCSDDSLRQDGYSYVLSCLVLSCGGCLESYSNLVLVRVALLLLWQLAIQTDQKGIHCDPANLGRYPAKNKTTNITRGIQYAPRGRPDRSRWSV